MKQALIVWGGWPGHEPERARGVVADCCSAHGFRGARRDTDRSLRRPGLEVARPDRADRHAWSKIDKAECDNLTAAVRAGVGMAGFHGGMCDAFRDSMDYQFMTGGQWVAHPGNIIDFRVNIAEPDDPVMAGLTAFDYRSEQYYMHVDPANEVLATTTFSGEHAPWIERRRDAGGLEAPATAPAASSTARWAMWPPNSRCRRCAPSSSAACCGPRGDPQPDPARLQPRSLDSPRRRRLLHRRFHFRVVSGRADPPFEGPRELGARLPAAHRASQLDMRGNPGSCGIWAPCLSFADGLFWLVYTDVKRYDGNFKDSHNFIVTAPSITGRGASRCSRTPRASIRRFSTTTTGRSGS